MLLKSLAIVAAAVPLLAAGPALADHHYHGERYRHEQPRVVRQSIGGRLLGGLAAGAAAAIAGSDYYVPPPAPVVVVPPSQPVYEQPVYNAPPNAWGGGPTGYYDHGYPRVAPPLRFNSYTGQYDYAY